MKEAVMKVVENAGIAKGIYELTLADDRLEDILPGQFANVGIPNRGDLILKRPFGIAKHDRSRHTITLCYQVAGKGTAALAEVKPGAEIPVTYPLGNGFRLDGKKRVLLVGGGVGVFPLLSAPLLHAARYRAYLGYRSAENSVYVQEFNRVCERVRVFTEDGSLGSRGYATDGIREAVAEFRPELVLACGPMPMFKSLQKALEPSGIPCQVSVEERMGCGIGACLVCACRIRRDGEIAHKRACADGPVFSLSEVVLDE